MASTQWEVFTHIRTVLERLLYDRRYFWYLAGLLVLGDTFLTQAIVRYIPFTEIDYETYMEQIAVYDTGVRDYTNIEGPTGPLVYPAGHVWIHKLLSAFTVSENGVINLKLAQQIYAALYLVTILLTCSVYHAAESLPNYVVIPLVLSKRLHSIFVLRLFNDCWAVGIMTVAILAFQKRWYVTGSALLSFALSVKMNILLYLPGLLVVLVQDFGLFEAFGCLSVIASIQALIGFPFLSTYPLSYVHQAFNFGRAFLFKWTVNWRFLSEEMFLSREFAAFLTACHLIALILFGFKWCAPDGGVIAVLQRTFARPTTGSGRTPITADRITTILLASNVIGITFARSLHYQFYSWYAPHLPLLLWHTRFPVPLRIALLAAVEYCWNVYPSTTLSSGLLLASHLTLLTGLWYGLPNGARFSDHRKQQ